MKRFLLITMAFPPKGAVGALRTYRLCKYLPEKSWLPEVITTYPWGITNRDSTLLEEIPKEVKVHRTGFFNPRLSYQRWAESKKTGQGAEGIGSNTGYGARREHGPGKGRLESLINRGKRTLIGLVSTPDHMVFWNLHLLIKGFQILRKNKDVRFILTSSPPHSSLIAGMVLGRIFRLPHVVDLRDPWGGRYWGEHSAFRTLVERALEKSVVRHAIRVISSTESYSRMARERFPDCDPEKFVTITNCYEPEKFNRIKVQRKKKFTMCYLGVFYPIYNPYPFFTALREWLAVNPEFRSDVDLCLVGDCDPTTKQVIRENGLEDIVTITGRIAHEQAIEKAKSSDLLLLLLGINDKVPRGCVPAKLYEYLACRKPILAYVPEGEALSIINRTGSGYAVTSDDSLLFIKILDKEYRSKRKGTTVVQEEQAVVLKEIEKFTSEYTNQRFVEVFESF